MERRSVLPNARALAVTVTLAALAGGALGVESCGGDDASSAQPGDDASASGDATLGDGGGDGGVGDSGPGLDAGPTPDAAPFAIDTSFGTGGVLTVNFGAPGTVEALSGARQADGKLLVGGAVRDAAFVARFTTAGALDATFGTNGVGYVPLDGLPEPRAVLVQSDGKIVLAGQGQLSLLPAGGGMFVARLESTGRLDTTFGSGGVAFATGYMWSAALQSFDGKILLAGTRLPGGGMALYRFLSTGALDATFGTGGLVTSTLAGDDAFAVVQQTDGKILVGGNKDGFELFLARFDATGAPDTGFGGSGNGVRVEFPSASQISSVNDIQELADTTLLLAGSAHGKFAVGHYLANGTPDTTWGAAGDGWSTIGGTLGTNVPSANSMGRQTSGKILAGGWLPSTQGVERFFGDGGIDTSYGTSGLGATATALRTVVGADDTATTVGTSSSAPAAIDLTRLDPGGVPDVTFGDAGRVDVTLSGTMDVATSVALVPATGAIVVAGYAGTSALDGLVRVTAAGALDTTFGGGGGTGPGFEVGGKVPYARSVAVQSTGAIVVGASQSTGFKAARYATSGALDSTFGTSGVASATTTVGGKSVLGEAMCVAPGGDGLLAVGSDSNGVGFALQAWDADGHAVTTFGVAATGAVFTPCATFGGATTAQATAAAFQADGKAVVAGFGNVAGGAASTKVLVARYTTLGALDASFGVGGGDAGAGAGFTVVDTGGIVTPYAIAVEAATGKVVLAGQRRNTSASGPITTDLVLVRLTASGALDATFGTGGVASTPMGETEFETTNAPFPVGLATTSDGRYVTAGTAAVAPPGIGEDALVVRFDAAGRVDARSVLSIGAGNDCGHAVAVQSDGKVVVVGKTWTPVGGRDYFVARLSPPP